MLTIQQIKDRQNGIGASDMAIILGLSNYKTPYQLYLEKIGDVEPVFEETALQEWGHALEPIIRIKFAEKENLKVRGPIEHAKYAPLCDLITYDLDSQVHPILDFMRCNLDSFIPELNAVHEIKCANQFQAHLWEEAGSDSIPLPYLVQVAHQCIVTNADRGIITPLIGGYDYRKYIYERDLGLESRIIDAAKKFWDCVQTRTPPEPINQIDLRLMYPKHNPEKVITINNDVEEQLTTLMETRSKIKLLTEVEEEKKFNIMSFMKDHEALVDQGGRPVISWKANKKGSRTFLVKGF